MGRPVAGDLKIPDECTAIARRPIQHPKQPPVSGFTEGTYLPTLQGDTANRAIGPVGRPGEFASSFATHEVFERPAAQPEGGGLHVLK